MQSLHPIATAAKTFRHVLTPPRIAASLVIVALTAFATPSFAIEPQAEKLICCGAEQVFIVDASDPNKQLWSWNASDSPSIPEDFRVKFRSTDDCKPYAGGLILITSSSQGVALIERDTKRCLFLAEVPNAHSACLLPGNQIAVAASTSKNEVQFFAAADKQKPATPHHRISLAGAHGTVWDSVRERLWALGTDELLEIKSSDEHNTSQSPDATPWKVVNRYDLPTSGGHDLSPAHDDTHLFVTTDTQVLRFNMTNGTFGVAEGFGDQTKIKSVDLHPVTKRIVFHQALPDEWWSHTIRFDDAAAVTLNEQRLYKIRWDVPSDRPQ